MLWVKALHVISIIAWMAGLLYLPRLFVYHSTVDKGSEASETFKIMEKKLLRFIMTPAMIAAWAFGLILIFVFDVVDWRTVWPWMKMIFVIALTTYHVHLAHHVRVFAADENKLTSRHFRLINEIPTVFMVIIVLLVVVKPF